MSEIKFDPNIENPAMPETAAYAELAAVRRLIGRLYNAAYWTPDRHVPDEAELWESLRRAIGQLPGQSPKRLPFDGVQVSYSMDRIRQVGRLVSAKKGRNFGTEEARALVLLYGQELTDRLDKTVRDFLQEKLG